MTARPFEREAGTANWALRLALLPIPLLIVAAVMHRLGQIETLPLFIVIAIAWGVALLALVLGVLAMRDIWRDGLNGFGPALAGSLLALVILAMPAFVVAEMIRLPRLSDISTDREDPPGFSAPGAVARPPADAAEGEAQTKAYPDIVARHYPVSPERVYAEVTKLVGGRGWEVVAATPPDAENADAGVEAVAKTLLLALPVDVSIRLVADDDGTLVDMRSASRIGAHDLGDNARRIRDFFADLDTALQGVTEAEEPAEPDTDLPPLPLAPPRR
ncbi:hypothetical protein K32_12660 [Kaistia sp. 32K]|uniref:DUF1499 domain-containing protein n=1 Tax=Kaistia sp. 32K TaxID=2795690 RepID=UPI00191541BD|nr:DUF1499 domain-containing protein [Kaistia sp. 32K]BCP52649.1 hypothetical protein K32_12660 [Kaistia sp. 32K]